MAEPRAGWYPDPSGDMTRVRYWDGQKWTDYYQSMPTCNPAANAPSEASQPYAPQGAMSSADQTLRLIAFVFSVLTCIGVGILLIPLAWCIPMTVHLWGIYKGTKPNTVAFGVCTLIFVNLISGILLLCSTKEE